MADSLRDSYVAHSCAQPPRPNGAARKLGRCIAGALSIGLLTGCPSGNDTAAGNRAPVIRGFPQSQVVVGTEMSFVPNVSDADGDSLTFTVENLPSWAIFDSSTGAISGTPGEGDIGSYPGISIGVSDGAATASLPSFTIDVVAFGSGSVTLTWSAPTQNTDGSPLLDLSGYKVYWGTEIGNYSSSVTVDNPSMTTYMVENLAPATWYFTATAFDSDGFESAFSNVLSFTIL